MAASATSMEYVQKMFLAYFGRPVAPTGQEYYGQLVDAGNVAALQDDFWNSVESQGKFGALSTEGKVNAIFNQLFARDAAAAGLTYWTTEINAGRVSLPQAALTILNSAAADDLAVFNAKLEVANAFTAELDTTAEILAYQSNIADAVVLLAGVTSAAEADAAVADITNLVADVVAGGAVVAGQTFTLTEAVDNIQGTAGNDTIIAGEGSVGGVHTLGSSDVVNGGAGTDTLNLKLAGAASAGQVVTPNISAVEIFNVQAIGADNGGATAGGDNGINLINASGYTELWSNNSTNDLNLTNVGTKAVVGVTKGVAAADYSVQYAVAAVTGAQDVVLDTATVGNLFIDSLGTGAIGATGFATVNVNAKAGTSTVGNLQSGGDITTLNVTGAGKLTITAAQNAALKTIDASANTGGTTLQIAALSGQNVTYTGGSGNDSINFNDTLTLLDKVDGGAGRNTLVVDDRTSIVTGLNVSNIQVLSLDNLNNATVEAGRIAGVDQVNVTATLGAGITGGAADSKINGLSSGNTVAIADSGAVLISVKNATVAGTADTFNLEVTAGADVNFQLPGVETINLNNNDDDNSDIVFSDADGLVDLRTLNIASVADSVTTAWNLNNTVKTVDASAALGDVGVSVLAGNPTNGVTITGGAGDDWLIGGDGKDAIVGGAGDDWLQGDANVGTAQQTTVAVGTTDIGDTYTLSINGTVVTVEATVATGANVEGLLATAINGNAIITAQGISADAISGDLVITGDAAGHAFTVANLDSTNAAARAETSTIALAIGADDGDTYRVTIGGTGTAADKNYDTAFAADATTAQARAAIITTLNGDADFVAQGFTAALNAAGEIAVTGPVGNNFTLALTEQAIATPTAQVDTITFAVADLTAGDIFTTTINGASVNYTMTGAAATDAAGLQNTINTAFGATVTALFVDGGVDGLNATTDTLTITANTAGTAFTSAISVNGAAAASAIANTTANDPVTTLAGNFVITETQAALVAGATANSAASLTVTETQVPVLGGTANADTLTGGDGNDTFVVLASGGKVGTSFTTMDTITDLNLGGSAVASQIDAVDLSFAVTSLVNAGVPVALTTAPTLVEAVDVLFAAGGVLNNQANKAGLFTYAGDTYLVAANSAGATFGADDVIVKVTGVQGTLDLSDLV